MNPHLIAGIGILVLLFGGIFVVGARLIGWRATLASYGITAAIFTTTWIAAYLIDTGTQ